MDPNAEFAPYHGIRVLDFGQYIAGPLAAMLFADQGADVIHVERPVKAAPTDPIDAVLQRNKSRVAIDLKSKGGLERALELVEGADVLIENFRPWRDGPAGTWL
jgi:crotonobetainyl-CoA:carnitine CoA-transferase CaiB-like acyl-CoA transferase